MPKVDGTGMLTNIRARRGLGKVEPRVEQLIDMLQTKEFVFDTFGNIAQSLQGVSV